MKIQVYNKTAKADSSVEVPDSVFSLPFNNDLVYQVYTAKLANKRVHFAHTKTRSEVRGGGRKPWRQKGTGRARHGSIRSPLWVGGGVTFGPRNDRAFSKKVNKKMNRKALAIALSAKAKDKQLFVVDSLDFSDKPKTKQAAALIKGLKLQGRSTVVYGTKEDKNFARAFSNLPRVKPVNIARINIVDILNNQNCVFSKNALNKIISRYEAPNKINLEAK